MNIYSFLYSSDADNFLSPLAHAYDSIICIPDNLMPEYTCINGATYIPIMIQESYRLASFQSVVSKICRSYRSGFSKFEIGAHCPVFLKADCAFEIVGGRKKLMYVILRRNTEVFSPEPSYTTFLSWDFVTDTKHPIYNGLKSKIFQPLINDHRMDLVVWKDLDDFLAKVKTPDNLDYQDDISKFLKSEEVIRYIDEH